LSGKVAPLFGYNVLSLTKQKAKQSKQKAKQTKSKANKKQSKQKANPS
jgi:hypothetical protein